MKRCRRLRGGVTAFFLLVAMPVSLTGLSLAGEWTSILMIRRQADTLADIAASAAASATYFDDPARIDPEAASAAASEMVAMALLRVPSSVGDIAMIKAHRGVSPSSRTTVDITGTVVSVTVEFALPSYPILDLLRVSGGAGAFRLSGSASSSAALCFPGDPGSPGCAYLLVQ